MTLQLQPVHVGLVAGGVAALATGIAETKYLDGVAERNPTGSAADGPATWIPLLTGLAGAGLGVFSLVKGAGTMAGALGAGAGFGVALGAAGAAIAFRVRHGIGVDTEVRSTFSSYNRDFDDVLDLNPVWRTPEYIRRHTWTHEHSNGYEHTHVDYYDISRLAFAADADHNQQVTIPELRAVAKRFDLDGDDRLKGSEYREYERRYGEESWWGNWIQ